LRNLRLDTFRITLLVAATIVVPASVRSQAAPRPTTPVEAVRADKSSPDEQHAPGSIEEEMKAKRAIKYAESEHKNNLEKAREVSELGAKLQSSFIVKKSIDRDDNKHLQRLHKLAKQLRNKAGGSDSEKPIENMPDTLEAAICRIAESSKSLSKLVQSTPRQVVSTAVIDEANVLLQLIDFARQFSR